MGEGVATGGPPLAAGKVLRIGLDVICGFWETPTPVLPVSGVSRTMDVPIFGRCRRSSLMAHVSRTRGWIWLTVAICLISCGCAVVNDPEPTTIGWWGASAASSKKKKADRSGFGSWFGPREPDRPRTVNEWMEQTSPVRP